MRYTEMVKNANDVIGSKGLDLLGNVYAPRGNVQVHLPFLEVTAFNPRSRITLTLMATVICPLAAGVVFIGSLVLEMYEFIY